ncbi:hypothetical protein OAN24_06675 [Pseudodesulfovibrio sp.]|nr:hypothetical protein [Pseudodesulfovibrio sp.]
MNKRLEITLFGTLYSVGAVHLTPGIIKVGVSAYGQARWHEIVSQVALGEASKKLNSEVQLLLGQPLAFSYHVQGIALHERGFGMEVFHGGEFMPLSMVEAENKALQPVELMRVYDTNDMLGVYWAKRQGAVSFRWDGADDVGQEEVCLVYDTLTPITASKRPFELALDVTWRGTKGRRKELGAQGALSDHQHVFHKTQ